MECGGSWHIIYVLAQYLGKDNKMHTQLLSNGNDPEKGGYTDCSIFGVDTLRDHADTYYITRGWGSHGNGQQFGIVQVFVVGKAGLVKCETFADHKSDLIIEYPRSEALNLVYNAKTRKLSFNEFLKHDDGIPEATGASTVLVWNNRIFSKK